MKTAYLISFFKALEARIPPAHGTHHAIHFALYGSDESDWAEKLALQISSGTRFRTIFLDADDLDKPIPQLVEEVASVLAQIANAEA